ncbi:MAG: redoxin domain-containing protein [Nitrospirae bacterium]|nr:redoxin domain-containing protein [Nitrospirota bacterium]
MEKNVRQKFKDKGVRVLAVNVKEDSQVVEAYRMQHGWTFPVLLDRGRTLAPHFAPSLGGLPPEVVIINGHVVLDGDLRVRHIDYLNVATFDASARQVVRALEELLK